MSHNKPSKIKVCLDNRLIMPGEYFVPIKGERFDGHDFVEAALKSGAKGVLEEDELYELASKRIRQIKPIIIGVTGSSGKTTVTNFLAQVLALAGNVCLGSLNTKLGLSVNVINDMDDNCRYFVAEMGMDKAGELTETTKLFPPDIVVITTINEVHLEKLGSIENIAKAKAEILYGLKKDGTAVLNQKNRWVRKVGKEFIKRGGRVIWYSDTVKDKQIHVPGHLLGRQNGQNVVCVATVCSLLGIDRDKTNTALQNLKPPKGRLNVIKGLNGSTIIDDTYNANPESTKYALEVLRDYEGGRKIAVLGSMLELGDYSKRGHGLIGRMVDKMGIDLLITVGEEAKIIKDAATKTESYWFETSETTEKIVKIIKPQNGDVILVKGSQGIRMEKVTRALMENPTKAEGLLVRQDVRWNK